MTKSIISLISINLLPLIGVIWGDWNIAEILLLYWSENIAIGFFNYIKMGRAKKVEEFSPKMEILIKHANRRGDGTLKKEKDRKFKMTFFLLHFGFFTFIHGILVFVLVGIFFGLLKLSWLSIILTSLFFFVSHGVSYWFNFIQKGECNTVSAERLFWQPYKRIFVMHAATLIGFFIMAEFDSPKSLLILFIFVKIIFDVFFHIFEHSSFKRSNMLK